MYWVDIARIGSIVNQSAGIAMRYSALKILKEGLTGNKGWKPVWREPDPQPEYDIIIVGGGSRSWTAVGICQCVARLPGAGADRQ